MTAAAASATAAATTYARSKPAPEPVVRLAAATPDITAAPIVAPSSWKVLSTPEATPSVLRLHLGECGGRSDNEQRPEATSPDADRDHRCSRAAHECRHQQPDGSNQQRHDAEPTSTGPPDEAAADLRPGHGRQSHRQEEKTRHERPVALKLLELERAQEEHRDHERGRHGQDERAGHHRSPSEQAWVEQGPLGGAEPPGQDAVQQQAKSDQTERSSRAPAAVPRRR